MFKHYHLHNKCKECKKEEGSCGVPLFYIKEKKLLYRECYCCLNTCIIIDAKNILFSIPQGAIKIEYKYSFKNNYSKEKEKWWDVNEDFFDKEGNLLPLDKGLSSSCVYE